MNASLKRRSSGINMATAVAENSDSIKVICRFRPPAVKQIDRRQSINSKSTIYDKSDSFKLSAERSEVEFNSELSDNKLFKFDKVH
jgi:hypothetical protein